MIAFTFPLVCATSGMPLCDVRLSLSGCTCSLKLSRPARSAMIVVGREAYLHPCLSVTMLSMLAEPCPD